MEDFEDPPEIHEALFLNTTVLQSESRLVNGLNCAHPVPPGGLKLDRNEQNWSHSNISEMPRGSQAAKCCCGYHLVRFEEKMLLWRWFWRGTLTVRWPQDDFPLKTIRTLATATFHTNSAFVDLETLLWLAFGSF